MTSESPLGDDTLARLADVIDQRRQADPDKSYVARLMQKGTDAARSATDKATNAAKDAAS